MDLFFLATTVFKNQLCQEKTFLQTTFSKFVSRSFNKGVIWKPRPNVRVSKLKSRTSQLPRVHTLNVKMKYVICIFWSKFPFPFLTQSNLKKCIDSVILKQLPINQLTFQLETFPSGVKYASFTNTLHMWNWNFSGF